MAQITWRNVNNSGGESAAVQGMALGAKTIMNAFDPLEDQLKKRAAIEEQNWDAQAAQNTRDVKARLQQIGSLGELNRMQDEGLITEDAFNKRFGAQYDPSVVNQTIDARRQALQRVTLDNINNVALAVADQERDLSAGGQRLRDLIRQEGGRGDFAERAVADFMNSNKDRLSQYAKINKNEVEKQLSNTPAPTSPEQLETYVAQAHKAGVKDIDTYRNRLTDELNSFYMHEKYGLDKARFGLEKEKVGLERARIGIDQARAGREAYLFNKSIAEDRALNTAYTTATKLMKEQGLTSKEAFGKVSSLIPGKYQSDVLRNITQQEIDMSSLTNPQKELMGRSIAKGQKQIADYQAAADSEVARIVKQREAVTGITKNVLDTVAKAKDVHGGVVNKIVDGISDTWWDGSIRVDTDKNDVEKALNNYRDQITIKLPTASPEEVDAVLLTAYQNSNKVTDSMFTGSNQGLDKVSMETAVNKQIQNFLKGEAIDQDRVSLVSAVNKDIANFNENLADFATASKQSIETLNKTNKAGDVVNYLKNMEDNTLTLPKDEKGHFTTGALAQRRQQIKKAADDRAAKEAADKLNNQREKQQQKPYRSQITGNPGADLRNNINDVLSRGTNPAKAIVEEPSIDLTNLLKKYQ